MGFEMKDYDFREHTRGGESVLYQTSDIDTSGYPAGAAYYGYLTDDGHWLIMEQTTTTIRYINGSTKATYLTAWAGRAGLTYVYYCDLA